MSMLKLPSMPYLLLITAVICATMGATGGYVVRGWKDGSADNKAQTDKANAAYAQINDLMVNSGKMADALNTFNGVTAGQLATLGQQLEDQSHAFTAFQLDLQRTPVGNCTFNPDADRLFQNAYQAAFGVSGTAGRKGQAGKRDAPHGKAPASAKTVLAPRIPAG